jgi:hypothetical protein
MHGRVGCPQGLIEAFSYPGVWLTYALSGRKLRQSSENLRKVAALFAEAEIDLA